MSVPSYSFAPGFRHLEIGIPTVHALAYAGLALLNKDPGSAAAAAKLTLQSVRVRSWQTDLYRALINLLGAHFNLLQVRRPETSERQRTHLRQQRE